MSEPETLLALVERLDELACEFTILDKDEPLAQHMLAWPRLSAAIREMREQLKDTAESPCDCCGIHAYAFEMLARLDAPK